jgi:ribosomal protein L7Ae-like RNA K-turn-binding protein
MDGNLNPDAFEFHLYRPPRTEKKTLFDLILKNERKTKQPKPAKPQKELKDSNKMIKAHIIQDNQIVTAKIPKKDLYSGVYEVVPRKTTKLKQIIKETRLQEGVPPNQRPIYSDNIPREYVNHILTQDLDNALQELLEKLVFFYQRKKEQKSNKKVQKRYVKGFKECIKKCNSNEIKCVVIAPNIEKVEAEGGLDEIVYQLINLCNSKAIPVVFGLSMRLIGGLIINNAALLSVVGIIDYSAAETLYQKVIQISQRNKQLYKGVSFDPTVYFNIR